MDETKFYHWSVQLDPDRSAAAYIALPSLDRSCCNACAVTLAAAERDMLPQSVTAFLRAAGVDLRKPQDTWGAPDQGFVNTWWLFIGHLTPARWSGAGTDAFVEPSPGFRCWLTEDIAMRTDPAFGDAPLVQFEVAWQSDALMALEQSVWPPPGAPAAPPD
jgi:hypothetical protein